MPHAGFHQLRVRDELVWSWRSVLQGRRLRALVLYIRTSLGLTDDVIPATVMPSLYGQWAKHPNQAIMSYEDKYGAWQLRLMGRPLGCAEVELGERAHKNMTHENHYQEWYRTDEIIKRACEANVGLGFVDFLIGGAA